MMPIEIIHTSHNWWVVNKPAGLSVHNAESSKSGEDLIGILAKQLKIPRGELAPVHRLDQETSGLILIARGEAIANLAKALERESSVKKYSAVLRGKFQAPEFVGAWDWPLSPKAEGRRNPQGIEKDLKPSKTLVKVLSQNQYFTVVELTLETGRTHQIRRHAALAKHNVVGDRRYDTDKYCDLIAQKYKFARLALHANELTLEVDGKVQSFNCQVPQEFLLFS